MTEQTYLRDDLAADRTLLANERTFLAYIRTAIMLGVSGVTILKVFPYNFQLMVLGYVLLPLAAAVAIFGYTRYRVMRKRIFSKRDTIQQ